MMERTIYVSQQMHGALGDAYMTRLIYTAHSVPDLVFPHLTIRKTDVLRIVRCR